MSPYLSHSRVHTPTFLLTGKSMKWTAGCPIATIPGPFLPEAREEGGKNILASLWPVTGYRMLANVKPPSPIVRRDDRFYVLGLA